MSKLRWVFLHWYKAKGINRKWRETVDAPSWSPHTQSFPRVTFAPGNNPIARIFTLVSLFGTSCLKKVHYNFFYFSIAWTQKHSASTTCTQKRTVQELHILRNTVQVLHALRNTLYKYYMYSETQTQVLYVLRNTLYKYYMYSETQIQVLYVLSNTLYKY